MPYCSDDGMVTIGASPVAMKNSMPPIARIPPIGTPVRNEITITGRIARNGSHSTWPCAYAQRSVSVASTISAGTIAPRAMADGFSAASFSSVNTQSSTRPTPSQIAT